MNDTESFFARVIEKKRTFAAQGAVNDSTAAAKASQLTKIKYEHIYQQRQ